MNRIIQLKGHNGDSVEDLVEIEKLLVDHFKELYHESEFRDVQSLLKDLKSLPIPKLDQSQQHWLDRPVIDAEIEWAFHQLHP